MNTPSKKNYNFNPPDGEYTFRIKELQEKNVGKAKTGTGFVSVTLISEQIMPLNIVDEDGTPKIVDSNAWVQIKFWATPKAVPKALDLIEATGLARPASASIKDEFDLADAINTVVNKKVKAMIKWEKSREWSGKTFHDYEVTGFKPAF